MKERKVSTEEALSFPVSPERLAALLRLVESGARVDRLRQGGARGDAGLARRSPRPIVGEEGAGEACATPGALEAAVAEVVAGNPSQVALYRSGKTQTFGWFVGQVMKKTGGRADPAAVQGCADAGARAPSMIQLFSRLQEVRARSARRWSTSPSASRRASSSS